MLFETGKADLVFVRAVVHERDVAVCLPACQRPAPLTRTQASSQSLFRHSHICDTAKPRVQARRLASHQSTYLSSSQLRQNGKCGSRFTVSRLNADLGITWAGSKLEENNEKSMQVDKEADDKVLLVE